MSVFVFLYQVRASEPSRPFNGSSHLFSLLYFGAKCFLCLLKTNLIVLKTPSLLKSPILYTYLGVSHTRIYGPLVYLHKIVPTSDSAQPPALWHKSMCRSAQPSPSLLSLLLKLFPIAMLPLATGPLQVWGPGWSPHLLLQGSYQSKSEGVKDRAICITRRIDPSLKTQNILGPCAWLGTDRHQALG